MQIFSLFGEILLNDNNTEATLEGIDKKAEGLGKKIGDVASKFALAGGAMALAIGGLAVNASDDLTKALNGVKAASGYSEEALGDMRGVMLDIYNDNFGESFDDIGNALTVIKQNANLSDAEVKNMAESAFALRDTFEIDVADSVKGSTMLMQQFGISGTDAYNLIAQGAQFGMNKNGDLLDIIQEYSVQFKQAGFDSEEMFNMLNAGAMNGSFSVDILGDGMKEFGIRSKDASDSTMFAFKALGLDAEKLTNDFNNGGEVGKLAFMEVNKALANTDDLTVQNQVGVALWGTMWEDLGPKAILSMTDAQGEISKTVDALGTINSIKYDSLGEAVTGIKRNLETGILIPISDKILPQLNTFASWFTANMPEIQQKIQDILPIFISVLATLMAFKGVALVIDGVRKAQEIWKGVVIAWSAVTKTATAIQLAMNAAWLANPIGIVIALIVALVAGIVILFKNNKQFHDFVVNSWKTIKDTISGAITSIIGFFKGLGASISGMVTSIGGFFKGLATAIGQTWNDIKLGVTTTWNGIKQFFVDVITSIVTFVTTTFSKQIQDIKVIFESLQRIFIAVWEIIKNIFLGSILLILDLVTGNFTKLKEDAINIFDNLKMYIGDIWDNLALIFETYLDLIVTTLTQAWDGIKTTTENIWNGLKTFLSTLWDGIKNTASKAWDALKTSVIDTCNAIITGAKDLWNDLLTWFRELPSKLSTIGSNMFTSMKNGIASTITGVKGAIVSGITTAIDWIKALPSQAVIWGKDMITGMINGIKSMVSGVGDAVKGVADKIRSFLHFSVPDVGPLTDYESWMPDFMTGLSQGIDANKYKVIDSIKSLTGNMSIGVKGFQQTNSTQSNQTIPNEKVKANNGLTLSIGTFINNRKEDIDELAIELEQYRQMHSKAIGGVY